jgi:hypothetical protein
MIVKVQLPLASSEETPLALIYDETKKFVTQVPVTDPLRAVMKGRAKAYFRAEIEKGSLVIESEVPPPPW